MSTPSDKFITSPTGMGLIIATFLFRKPIFAVLKIILRLAILLVRPTLFLLGTQKGLSLLRPPTQSKLNREPLAAAEPTAM